MTRTVKTLIVGTILLGALGCAEAPAAPPQAAAAPPAPPPGSAPSPAAPSEAVAKADALIEEMRRNQAAFEKAEREAPKVSAPRLEDFNRPAAPTHAPPPAQHAPQPGAYAQQPSAPIAAPASDARGKQWWKDQARTLQDKVEDETRRMTAARIAMNNATLKITADEAEREYLALVAAVRNAQAALDRLRDDARRAGVPPGWARWP